MRKLLLLGSLLATMSGQAQETASLNFYWPGERVSELTDNTQYFIYNTANDGQDRSWFIYSNGSALKTTNVSPLTFVTTENKYLFTTNKPQKPNNPAHWYLNSIHGIVGHGGQTNNTEARDIYIAKWFKTDTITKSTAKSEDEKGTLQNPNETDTKVWAVTVKPGVIGDLKEVDTYAWNGDPGSWVRWREAHPYAFYTVKSVELSDEDKIKYYNEISDRNGMAGDIAWNLQTLYGKIKDGSKYFSNHPETTPAEHSSYANLVDGNDNSIFHSSWSAPGTDKHYLRAELPEATKSFYIITKRRTSNNNNRPTSILVEGSDNAEGTYTTITTLRELPVAENEYYYFSDKIPNENAYQYIRFTPEATNTNSAFFTYSEFYIIEANDETEDFMNKVKAFYHIDRNPKNENFVNSFDDAKYKAAEEVQESLRLKLAKAEITSLVTDCANKHAEKPKLGQYPTDAYNTLKAAAEKEPTTSTELNEAIKAFKFSINAPVFTINGAFDGGYKTVGKSIYYSAGNATNPLRWDKSTNKYDKTMLWKFAGSTSITAEAGQTYTAMNMAENVYFWNVEQLNVTETNPTNTDGIVLIKTVGNNSPIHAQDGGLVVRWDNSAPNSASGWTITYVGESFKIDQVNEEQLTAYAQLKTLVPQCEPYQGKFGSDLGEFTGDEENFNAALATAKGIIEKDIYANPDLDAVTALDNLQAAKGTLVINQPATGKFYRFKSATQNNYIASNGTSGRPLMTGNADEAVFYLTADGKLITSSLLAMDNYNIVANLGQATTFQASNNKVGTYVIRNNGHSYYAKATGQALDRWGNESEAINNQANCAWILEEVKDEAQQPKLSKTMKAEYATLGAPVALNIPEGVKAYTVTVNEEKTVATLNEVLGGIIPAGCGVVLEKTDGGSEYNFTFAAGAEAIEGNRLVPLYTETTIPGTTNAYVLADKDQGLGFYQLDTNSRNISANKAYLVLDPKASYIRSITIGGPTTGIEETVANGNEAEEYYDLQGRRVLNPTKGIYVTKSGKKVIFNK